MGLENKCLTVRTVCLQIFFFLSLSFRSGTKRNNLLNICKKSNDLAIPMIYLYKFYYSLYFVLKQITTKSSLFVGHTFLWSIHENNIQRNFTSSAFTNIPSTYIKTNFMPTKWIQGILHKINGRNVSIPWCNVQICLNAK
jgi:hypothetical protein